MTRINPFPILMDALKSAHGPLAQLGERLHGMEEVMGSSPTRSTMLIIDLRRPRRFFVLHFFSIVSQPNWKNLVDV